MSTKLPAYLTMGLSAAVSVILNVFAVRDFGPVAVAIAPIWPLLAVLTIHLVTDTKWPVGRVWAFGRFGATLTVALSTAALSFSHIADAASQLGQSGWTAYLAPIALDGAFVMASMILGITPQKRAAATRAAKKRK